MGHKFLCRFVKHPRLLVRAKGIVGEAVDASLLNVFMDTPLVYHTAEIRTRTGPIPLLNDPSMHVYDHHGSIRRGCGPEWAKVDITGADKFSSGISITENGAAVFAGHFGTADESANWLGNNEVALEISREAVTPVDSLSGTSSEVIKASPLVDAASSALHVWHVGNWKNFSEAVCFLARQIEGAVGDGLLEVEGGLLSTGRGVVIAACVIHADTPLTTTSGELLHFKFSVGETVSLVFVSDVDPVIEVPN